MERKTFLWLSIAGSASLLLPMGGCKEAAPPIDKETAKPGLLGQCIEDNTIRQIGVAYRKKHKDEDKISKLNALLQTGSKGTNLRTLLEQKITDDFKEGRYVQVNGWILSITEARQAALYSLLIP